jgi:hypothetical protein
MVGKNDNLLPRVNFSLELIESILLPGQAH